VRDHGRIGMAKVQVPVGAGGEAGDDHPTTPSRPVAACG
jgi:hypothetical protein